MSSPRTPLRAPEALVLSDEERRQVQACLEALRRNSDDSAVTVPRLTTSDAVIELSPDLAVVLQRILAALSEGQGISLVPLHRQLTTQEAADLLNISRPTLIKVLERGDLPFTLTGRHRRVRLDDLLSYQAAIEERRDEALRALREDAEDAGLHDLLDGTQRPRTR